MSTPTMVYRPFKDGDAGKVVENEFGKWEWLIVELEEGTAPPDGWQATPYGQETVSEPDKPKRRKKAEADPVEGTPDGDGN